MLEARRLILRGRLAIVVAIGAVASLSACAPAVSLPAVPPESGGPTTLLVRLGSDTLAMEQYTRTPSRMEGVLVQRTPFTTIARYSVDIGPDHAPVRAEYSLRRGDGTTITNQMQSLSVRFSSDSVTFVGHRSTGDTTRAAVAPAQALPYLNGSYGLFELALARMLATRRDSSTFALLPLSWGARGSFPMPVKLVGRDSARISWFGFPVVLRYDGRGGILWLDGRNSTVKVRVDRVAALDLDTLAGVWTQHDVAAGVAGAASTRDTARATIGRASLWVDYGRPALRGRSVWVNGVLGDTLWRTGANAATQLRTESAILIGGVPVPVGTYSLWTHATARGYELIINKQFGQWGTEYHPEQDLVRVPLRVSSVSPPVERFTIALDPQGALVMTWGDRQLSTTIRDR